MEQVLRGLQWKSLLLYLDAVIVYSPTFESHMERLATVFQRFSEANLKLKPGTYALLQKDVTFLGHVVSSEGVATDPEKVKAVTHWPTSTSQKEVRTLLGFVGYYRRFCPDYGSVAKPLTRLTARNTPFEWKDEQQQAFDQLKRFLTEAPVYSCVIY